MGDRDGALEFLDDDAYGYVYDDPDFFAAGAVWNPSTQTLSWRIDYDDPEPLEEYPTPPAIVSIEDFDVYAADDPDMEGC